MSAFNFNGIFGRHSLLPGVVFALSSVLAGCSTTGYKADPKRFPETVPTGALDFKQAEKSTSGASMLPPEKRLVLSEAGAPKLYSFRANGQSLRVTLAQFAQAYKLNIVPDADITGSVSVEFQNLPLERALDAILDPIGLGWVQEDGLIRISRQITRTFNVDYLRATRTGTATMSASGDSRGGGTSTGSISSNVSINFWNELEGELKAILTRSTGETGGNPAQMEVVQSADRVTNMVTTTTRPLQELEGRVTINKMTGIVQVTAAPKRIRAVDAYMEKMMKGINRQVYIEARIVDVALAEDSALGIDWNKVTFGNTVTVSSQNIVTNPFGGVAAKPSTLNILYNKTFPPSFLVRDIAAAIRALEEEGAVRVVSQPRIRTLNNQPAIVRVGTERTFYTTQTTVQPNGISGTLTTVTETPTTVTEGVTLSVTPQVSTDGFITLDVTPVVNKIVAIDTSPSGNSNAPRIETKQTSTLVRIRDGETVAIGGLIIEEDSETDRGVPGAKNVPVAGWLFKGKYNNKQRKELVVFLTPHLVEY